MRYRELKVKDVPTEVLLFELLQRNGTQPGPEKTVYVADFLESVVGIDKDNTASVRLSVDDKESLDKLMAGYDDALRKINIKPTVPFEKFESAAVAHHNMFGYLVKQEWFADAVNSGELTREHFDSWGIAVKTDAVIEGETETGVYFRVKSFIDALRILAAVGEVEDVAKSAA